MAYRDEVLADTPLFYWGPFRGLDQTSNGRDATVFNPVPAIRIPAGFAAVVGVITDGNYYARIEDIGSLLSSGFCLEAGFIATHRGDASIFSLDGPTGANLLLYFSSFSGDANVLYQDTSTPKSTVTGATLDLNTPNHVAVCWDGTDLKFYLNGVLEYTGVFEATMPTGASFTLAANYASSSNQGQKAAGTTFYDTAVYDNALDATTVASHSAAFHSAINNAPEVGVKSLTYSLGRYVKFPKFEGVPDWRTQINPITKRDLLYGGDGSGHLYGPVTVVGEVKSRKVRIHHRATGKLLREAYSDPTKGDLAYDFGDLDVNDKFTIIGIDNTDEYNAVIEDNATPKPLP